MNEDYKEALWLDRFKRLQKQYEDTVEWWNKNKTCKCDLGEEQYCKHFQKIVWSAMGKTINELWEERIQMANQTLLDLEIFFDMMNDERNRT